MTRELTSTMPSRGASSSSRNNLDYSRHMRTHHDLYSGEDFDYEHDPIVELDDEAAFYDDEEVDEQPYWYG